MLEDRENPDGVAEVIINKKGNIPKLDNYRSITQMYKLFYRIMPIESLIKFI